jgi:hypothetical protein
MTDAFYRDTADAAPDTVAEINFERLEVAPIASLEQVYRDLGMEFGSQQKQRVERYLATLAGFRKNQFACVTPQQAAEIESSMGLYIERWGYAQAASRAA